MKKFLTFAAVAMTVTAVSARVANYQIVPLPAEITMQSGDGFNLDARTRIVYPNGNAALKINAEHLAGYLQTLTGIRPEISDKKTAKNVIVLTDNLPDENREAYRLTVRPEIITIEGASAAGNFYGIQTLRKSIPGKAVGEKVTFPATVINDRPEFKYRGGHFDSSRHFFPVEDIKQYIEMLALHNDNVMHWHLTDDQGWRLEIKKYPQLAEIGQWRTGTCFGHQFDTSDSIPYGGYYTQEQVKDIIRYAADRHITIIPEINIPGHCLAALQAYPELGCTGGPYATWTRWGISDDLLCAGNDSTLAFIDGVLTEVMELFPSPYIHIGGDECPKSRWEQCPRCQTRIAELGLTTDEHGTKEQKLQAYVTAHAANTVNAHGREMIGWEEIMEGGLTPGAVVMSWKGEESGLKAAQLGHDAIMTPASHCYFDYYQVKDRTGEPEAIGGYLPLSKTYSYVPVPETFTPAEAAHILGVQANLWTEYIPTISQAFYQALPRFAALSEVQWRKPADKDYDDFMHRLPQLIRHYEANGMNYCPRALNGTDK